MKLLRSIRKDGSCPCSSRINIIESIDGVKRRSRRRGSKRKSKRRSRRRRRSRK